MTIKLLAGLLLLVAIYLSLWAFSNASYYWIIPTIILLFEAIGLFLNKPWSQYLWHFIALFVSLWWVSSVARVALSAWPYKTLLESAISLIPGLLLVVVCSGASAAVAKHFRNNKNAL